MLDNSHHAITQAHSGLAGELATFEAQVLALTEKAKVLIVKHSIARTEEAARNAMDAQAGAMAKAGTQLFTSVVKPRIQHFARVIAHQVDRVASPWGYWSTHAVTALAASIASSGATLAIAAELWRR